MKKVASRNLFILLLLTFLISCSHKEVSMADEPTKAQEVIFSQALWNVKGVKTTKAVEKMYYPEALNQFFFRHIFVDGEQIYLIEKYYPLAKGRIDCIGFYSPESDSGDWVELTVDFVEEERFGNELEELLKNDFSIEPPVDFTELPEEFTEIEKEEKKENTEAKTESEETKEGEEPELVNENEEVISVERRILASNNRLKVMEYEKEIFLPIKDRTSTITIHSNQNHTVRTFYDDLFKVYKKEIWIIKGIKDSVMKSKEEFSYDGNRIVKKTTTLEDKKIDALYTRDGLVKDIATYERNGESEQLKHRSSWEYDNKNRIVQEESIEYEMKNGQTIPQDVKKEVYNYRKVDGQGLTQPDYEYYENDVLKIKTEYTAENAYVNKIFFDETFAVISYYENNKKVKDVYTVGGFVKRVKKYE